MKFNFIPVLIICILLGGCYSSQKKAQQPQQEKEKDFTKSGICYMRSDEDKWRTQSVEQMRESRKIPSVDFEFDSIILERSAYQTLDKIAKIMTGNRRYKLIVEGHADSVGTDDYNDWLSKARANAIKAYLVSRDVYSDAITAYGLGNRMPLVKDDSPDGRACNRRVVFTLTTRNWETIY
ncbi:MAG: OmpA family protein [Elusimicrobiota bacterium]|jgi:outer membrane protein OmpA-like peptidoglycan-associated protein|nr:OmpA family protein [Elusimicrobiota bacterium]